ncbi:MAG: glycosyl transferase family 2 [Bacteroidetes bacterium SW_9_63_38]|nr:MAG: glycosyl transferase family 2 [Bacteroidetes bacterium SW_9_63_38]
MLEGPLWIWLTGLAVLLHVGLWGVLLSNLVYLWARSAPSVGTSPAVSICIPARNEAENLRRLLPSLLDQNYPDLEIIVWDDGSEDETWEVLQSFDAPSLTVAQGDGPPEGWIGKVHALYQCTRRASGDRYLFLDADTALTRSDALRRLVEQHEAAESCVSTGLPRLRGGAQLLVSLVPYALLTGLPWPLVPRTSLPGLSALNGQCWCVDASLYHTYEPHATLKNAVLEDVGIGRYLKAQGHPPVLLAITDLVSVHMYEDLRDAWQGFRKNAYLLLGGAPLPFLVTYGYFLLTWLVAPLLSLWLLASLYGLKALTDRVNGIPAAVALFAPLSFALGLILQFDSAVHHWTDRVTWKGRPVPSSQHASPPSVDASTEQA